MNWKLILGLSLFGLVMAFITVYTNAPRTGLVIWLIIFAVSAYVAAKNADGRFFLHGFLIGIMDMIWVTAFHIKLAALYLAHHPQEVPQFTKMQVESGATVAQVMMLTGGVTALLSGIVLGVFTIMASKILASIYS